MIRRSRNTITAVSSASSSGRTWPSPWTWNCSGRARARCRPPSVCWNGSSPTTAATSMPSSVTGCTVKLPSSTSASTTTRMSWWFSKASTACCFRTPRDSSANGRPRENGPRAGEPSSIGTRKASRPRRAYPNRCGSCTPARPSTVENASPDSGRKRTRLQLGIGPPRSARTGCPCRTIARGPLAVGHRERLFQRGLHPLGPGPCLQARTDGNSQFRAHAVLGVRSHAVLLVAKPQAALS